jgi:hypothetical protein
MGVPLLLVDDEVAENSLVFIIEADMAHLMTQKWCVPYIPPKEIVQLRRQLVPNIGYHATTGNIEPLGTGCWRPCTTCVTAAQLLWEFAKSVYGQALPTDQPKRGGKRSSGRISKVGPLPIHEWLTWQNDLERVR